MQIHELNNFNGTPGATNFLAIDDGSDTSRISGEALLDPVNSRIDNLTANVLPDSVETILDWADVESASKTLTKNVSGFDYLDLYFKEVTSGTNRIVFAQRYPRTAFPAQVTIPVISWGGGSDPKYLYFQDLMIAISGTTLTMSQLRIYSWDGKAADGANIETGILVDQIRVDGVKISSNTSAELTDLRTAHNGTVYASARAAREADYNALDSNIASVADDLEETRDILQKDISELNNGSQNFGFDYTFIHGYIYQGNVTTGITYRFVPVDIMQYDKAITVNIADGFKVGYYLYHNDGTFYVKVTEYTTPFTIAANQKFRIEIKRITDNTSEVASYAEFVGAVTFKSAIEEKFDSIDTDISNAQNDINALESKFDKRLYVNENQIALTGSGQFVTKDFDIPCDDVGQCCCVYVESDTNVTIPKPIRFRFLNDSNQVIGTDKYIEVGKIGYLFCPSGATKFRVSLYGTVSGELVSTTAYFNNVKMWKGNPADDFINEVVPTPIFAESLAIEGYSILPDNPLLPSIAHRGYSLTAPECTGVAVKEAKRRGFTGVENDVALTSDGKFVMWHDATLAKIGDSSHSIGDYTLAELKAMDFGAWKSPKYTGEKILTFEEWVLLAKKLGLKLYIDTKFEFTTTQIEELANIVNKYGMMDSATWYINFNGGYLTKLRELYPTARVIYMGVPTEQACSVIAELLATGGPHSAAILPSANQLTAENAAIARSYNIDLECYYVSFNDLGLTTETIKNEIKRVANIGITGIVIDMYRACDVINEELIGR